MAADQRSPLLCCTLSPHYATTQQCIPTLTHSTAMEVDYTAAEEWKEGDAGALLETGEEAARSHDESPMQIEQG